MNKAQLVEVLSDRMGGKDQAAMAVEHVLDAIVRAVVAGDTVSVTGFGTIGSRVRAGRVSHNVATGTVMRTSPTRVPCFRPGTRFKDLVAGRKPLPNVGNSIQKAPKSPRP
nr:HU family DNA-binding protein [Streptomyces sp. NBC_00857]